MNIWAILGIFRPCFLFLSFMENDFFKPTHPTKVWKIPYFFFEPFPKQISYNMNMVYILLKCARFILLKIEFDILKYPPTP